MATIVKTTLLNDGDEVLVKGTKGRQTVLYINSWNEYQRKLEIVGAEKDFDHSVEEFYAPLMDGVSAIRVNDTRAYAGLASKYTRSLVLNAIDPDMPYVVDIFEVAGGTLHDYHLRSTSQHPSTAKESLPMQPMAGLRVLLMGAGGAVRGALLPFCRVCARYA